MYAKIQLGNKIKSLKNQAVFITNDGFFPEKDEKGNFKITFEWLSKHNFVNEWSYFIEKPISEGFEQLITPEEAKELCII